MKKTNIFILTVLLIFSFNPAQAQLSATDSVIVSTQNLFANGGRGFRISPNADLIITALGKRIPNTFGNYTWVIWRTSNQTVVHQQTSTSNFAGVYTYEPISTPVQLLQGISYDIMLYCDNSSSQARQFFGPSSQINSNLTYLNALWCVSCGPSTYPTATSATNHFGTPDFHFSLASCNSTASSFTVVDCGEYTVPSGDETYTFSGTQTVMDTIFNNCGSDSVMSITVTILPALTGVNNTTICAEGSIVINGTTYNAANSTGTEIFTNIGQNNCDSTVTVNLTVLPVLTGIVTSTICNNGSVIVNGNVYDATMPIGIEVFTNIGPNNCDSTVTVNITVENAIDTSTNTSGMVITSNATGASYEWIDCTTGMAIVPAETNQNYTATANGDYAVVVTIASCSDTSACVNITGVGIEDSKLAIDNLTLYPNPATGNITIELGISTSLNNQYFSVSIVNITGKEVYRRNTINQSKLEISLTEFSKGIYFVKVQSDKQQKVIKLIKQ